MMSEGKERLWTRNYIFVCIAAFMMAFSFFYSRTDAAVLSQIGFRHRAYDDWRRPVMLRDSGVERPSVRRVIADMRLCKKIYITAYALFARDVPRIFLRYLVARDVHRAANPPRLHVRNADDRAEIRS